MAGPRDDIIRALADEACRRVTERAIVALRAQPAQLSGDDSQLRTAFDELCVQVQEGESIFWDAYELTAKQAIEAELAGLLQHEREAVWLQTDAGWDWLWDLDNPDDSMPPVASGAKPAKIPCNDSDSADHVYREYLLPRAEDYSNAAIEACMAHGQRGRAELDRDAL